MASQLPHGEAAPADGSLPAAALADARARPLGLYIHVPFCATRCGYCDFNTYTAGELGDPTSTARYLAAARAELALAARILGDERAVSTVFFGGGTPTLLPAADLVGLLAEANRLLPLTDDAEVTTEANPESVDQSYLEQLRAGGFTRVSLGMQSSRPHVLEVLDRKHSPGRPEAGVRAARAAGFEQVSLDLIYGTPGETDADWSDSLAAAIGTGADHISAYALVVEDGTALARKVARAELPRPDDDSLADRYLIADAALAAAGLEWYEISNWAAAGSSRCRHNELYWRSADWWGIGPGAHSHVGGVRWWNVKHPAAYASRLDEGLSPAHSREQLDESQRHEERVLLEVRLREGLAVDALDDQARAVVARQRDEGFVDADELDRGRVVLTLRGRMLADLVVRDLLT